MTHPLPKPVVNGDSQRYWQGAAEGRLLLYRRKGGKTLHFMPRHMCPETWTDDLEWVEASGRGTVHSYTIIRRASDPAFAPLCPYVVALIDLEEGPRMMANILGDDALETRIGARVMVTFEDRGEGAKIPQFQLAAG